MSVVIDEETTVETKLKPPTKFNLWALNNDITSFEEVIWILTTAFGMSSSVAGELARKVDSEGRAKVNPKPMSKALAQIQLDKVNDKKRELAYSQVSKLLGRTRAIMELKFIIKED